MDIFAKTHGFASEPCEARFIMDACALFDYFWTVEQKHPPTPIQTLGIARIFFI